MKEDPKNYSLTIPPIFPGTWTKILDEVIPTFVKERFSPSDSWRNKPFDQEDVKFFSKGLIELSDFFTEDREGAKLPNYFTTARFRSSYFLYFFGLQGAKFLTLYDRNPKAIRALLDYAVEKKTLRIIDVGSGPGTASLALLVYLLDGLREENGKSSALPFSIELHWIDHNETILKDGEILLSRILERFPEFQGNISLTKEARVWWAHPRDFNFEAGLVVFGNVLNEAGHDPRIFHQGLAPFFKNPRGAGVLMMEPAFKSASQRLSQIRDEIVAMEDSLPIWGPCFHSEACPLANGRDWCHFSVPAKLPGTFFKKFSVKLGSVREWLKFSYVWFAGRDYQKEARPPKGLVRILSDPLKRDSGLENQVCRPVRVSYVQTPRKPIYRGEVIRDPILQSHHPKNRN